MPDGPQGEATPAGEPTPAARRRRRRAPAALRDRKVQVLSATLVVLVVASAVVWWGRRDSREDRLRRDAGFGSLTAEQAEATREYLAGDGAPLMDLTDLASRVTTMIEGDEAVPGDCDGAADDWDEVQQRAGDEGLAGLLGPLPDRTLGRLWSSQATILSEAMWLCAEGFGDAVTEQMGQVANLQEAVDLRLDDVGNA
jgi:hypothetical protein